MVGNLRLHLFRSTKKYKNWKLCSKTHVRMRATQSVYMNLLVLTFYIWILKRKWATLIIKMSTTRVKRSPWYKLSDDIFMSFYYFKKSWIETSLLERLAWKSPPGAKSRFIRWRSLAKIILKRFDHTNVRIILANNIFILKILSDPSSSPWLT